MFTVLQTLAFQEWLDGLRDRIAQLRIVSRIRQAEAGNLGDWKSIEGPLFEMRVDVGPGYRLYCARREGVLIVMLAGGAKTSQSRDIARAKRMLKEMDES